MKDYANLLRRFILDSGYNLFVIPRTKCIRIVNRVDVDPEFDMTIYPSESSSYLNKAAKQYLVRFNGNDLGMLNYTEIINKIKNESNNNDVR